MTDKNFSILKPLASNYMTVQIKGACGIKKATRYAEGAALIAHDTGGDESAFAASRKLFPKGFDEELNALIKAYNAKGSAFRRLTVPFGMAARAEDQAADGKKQKAQGKRLVAMKLLVDGTFDQVMREADVEIAVKKAAFRAALPRLVAGIQADHKLGRTFDIDDYPTQDDVDGSFTWTIDGPEPIPDGRMLEGLPVDAEWVGAIESQMESKAAAQVQFAQQSMANDTVGFLQAMAKNLDELVKFHDGQSPGRKKAPRIAESLTGNLNAQVQTLRTYAIPETPEGAALLRLADEIMEQLEPDRIDADDLKSNISLARSTAARAAAMIASLDELPVFM